MHPPPAWANFSIMKECTPESDRCHSVCTLWGGKGLCEAEVGKSRSNTLRPLHNTFSRPVGYPVYTNLGGAIETGTLFLDRRKQSVFIYLNHFFCLKLKLPSQKVVSEKDQIFRCFGLNFFLFPSPPPLPLCMVK